MDHASTLTSYIKDLIAANGPMTIERYMEIVLQDPDHGYYRHGNPLGPTGDFLTSPDASPLFGEMVGAWCVAAWKQIGMPSSFVLLELGPGQGSLLKAALNFAQRVGGFAQGVRLHLLESSSTLRRVQSETLSEYSPVHVGDLDAVPSLPMIVIANEFFDTLPIRQFVRSYLGWRERVVINRNGRLQFSQKYRGRCPGARSDDTSRLEVKVGGVYETSHQARHFMQAICNPIAMHGGAGLIIDYGYLSPPEEGTLDAFQRHGGVDILAMPGRVDVTAGVDFAVLARVATQSGMIVADVRTQNKFLEQMGISYRAKQVFAQANVSERASLTLGLDYISSPYAMGKHKVLEFGCCPGIEH